ncbi:MAG: CotH kinase family protein [bacterium]
MKTKNIIPALIFMFAMDNVIFSQDESWKVYDDSQVALIDITMNPADLVWMYENVQSDSLHLCSVHFTNAFIDTVIENAGVRLRGNTSRDSQKKSFKLSFNEFESGREFYGLDALNLNGEHNDPSIIRAKLCWDLYQQIGAKASRAAHVAVHINGAYYGLYISVEHVDDEFLSKNFNDDTGNLWKCLYPADLKFIDNNPDSYKMFANGRRTYDLTTNEELDDYSKLAELIDIINNSSRTDFPIKLEDKFSVAEALKYFAMNILTASWDDYWFLKNNYYLYHEPAKDLFHWIPYDYDNTFGIDFGFNPDWATVNPYNFGTIDGTPRPLITKMLAINEYKNLYTHFLEFYSQNVFDLPVWENRIDDLKSKIISFALSDTYRTLDWGFTNDDFNNSYSSTGYNFENGVNVQRGIKEFINVKNQSLSADLTYISSVPMVYSIQYSPQLPSANDVIEFSASVFSNAGLQEVVLEFHPGVLTVIEEYPMTYSPVAGTKKVEESDQWICTIPALGESGFGKYQIRVVDINGNTVKFPRSGPKEIRAAGAFSSSLVINEFLASNASTNTDTNGEYDDWVEIYNPSSENVLLDGLYLTDSPALPNKWQFPNNNIVVPAQGFVLVWCDDDEGQSGLHTNFKFDAQGEFIGLVGTDGLSFIDSLSYGEQSTDISFGRYPDGSENWIQLPPTPGSTNLMTSIDIEDSLPAEYRLSAFPNPFNPVTTIQYSIPQSSEIRIAIYDILGREIISFDEGVKPAGSYIINWNALSPDNRELPSGINFCRIDAGEFNTTIKLMLLK